MTRPLPWLVLAALASLACQRQPRAPAVADAGPAPPPVAWTAESAGGRVTVQQRGESGQCILESRGGKGEWNMRVCAATADQLTFVSEDGLYLVVLDPMPEVRDGRWEEAIAASLFRGGAQQARARVGDLFSSSERLHFFVGTVGWLRGTVDLEGHPPRYGPEGATVQGELADGSPFSFPFAETAFERPRSPPPATPDAGLKARAPPPLPPLRRSPPPPPTTEDDQAAMVAALAEYKVESAMIRGMNAAGDHVRANRLTSAAEELEHLRSSVRNHAGKVRELADYEGKIALHLLNVGNVDEARRFANIGVETDSGAPRPREALGQVAYARNDLPAALSEWNRGLASNPGDAELRVLVAKGQTETASLKTYRTRTSDHFILTFEGREDREMADLALTSLEEAYQKLPALYAFKPTDQLPVVLYPDEDLEQVETKPKWAAGVFDGKVRMGSSGAINHPNRFRSILAHEYGHAILHRAVRNMSSVPGWFDEGMAQAAAGLLQPEVPLNCAFGHQAALKGLGGGFASLPGSTRQISQAYLTARHAVEGLLARKGRGVVQDIIQRAGKGEPFEEAFERATGQGYDSFIEAFDQKDCAAQSWK